MTLMRRLVRVEQSLRSEMRGDWGHFFEGVTVPATGDRLAFLEAQLARASVLFGEALDQHEAVSVLAPLFSQLTLDELRALRGEPE